MIKDKHGEGGFMEAMAAMMVVTVGLTAFLGILAYSELPNENAENDYDFQFLNDLSVVDGKIDGDLTDELCMICERYDLSKAELKIELIGPVYYDSKTFTYGDEITDDTSYYNGTIRINSNEGRSLIATYEAVFFK